jgi:hypothetical protein
MITTTQASASQNATHTLFADLGITASRAAA